MALKDDKWIMVGENCEVQTDGDYAYVRASLKHDTGQMSKSGNSKMITPGISAVMTPGVKFTFNVYAPLPKDKRPKKA